MTPGNYLSAHCSSEYYLLILFLSACWNETRLTIFSSSLLPRQSCAFGKHLLAIGVFRKPVGQIFKVAVTAHHRTNAEISITACTVNSLVIE